MMVQGEISTLLRFENDLDLSRNCYFVKFRGP